MKSTRNLFPYFIIVFSLLLSCNEAPNSKDMTKGEKSTGKIFNAAEVWNIYDQYVLAKYLYPLDEKQKVKDSISPDTIRLGIKHYKAATKAGIIGNYRENISDRPEDNVFEIFIPETDNIQEAYLTYEVYGVGGSSSVSRSINEGPAIGGLFVVRDTVWRSEKEAISVNSLKKGTNIIRFSTPANAQYGYLVRNVGIYTVKSRISEKPSLKLNNSETHYYNGKAYISGYISGVSDDEVVSLKANGQELFYKRGEFFGVIYRSDDVPRAEWDVIVELQTKDGLVLQEQVQYQPGTKRVEESYFSDIKEKSFYVTKDDSFSIEFEGIKLIGESGSLDHDATIEVITLRSVDVMPTQSGLVNVSGGHFGYRMLPHGLQFSKPVRISLPYDSTLIPPGHLAEDIRTYYFDDLRKKWIALPFDSLDRENRRVYSYTSHFTDFINGVIEVPESPETTGFTPTGISDLKVVNPAAGINSISLPKANNRGSAQMDYPLKIPGGRQGLAPDLSLRYSSEGGSGWVGYCWALSVPSVSVETRWGVPRYDAEWETESYILSGQQLIPLAHRSERVKRTSNKRFYPRIEGSFNRIIRKGDNPTNYWWEVTTQSGTKYYYGSIDGLNVNSEYVVASEQGNIAEWKLAKIIDVNGNEITYTYEHLNFSSGLMKQGVGLVLKNINYTGKDGLPGKYDIVFHLQDNVKSDARITCNYGFKVVDAYLLDKIEISYDGEPVRYYGFKYEKGAFEKMLLTSITEYDSENNEFYKHEFEYFDEVRSGGVYSPFQEAEEVDLGNDKVGGSGVLSVALTTALGANESFAYGGGSYLGVGIGANTASKGNTVGGSFYYNKSDSKGIIQMIDLNGDRLPDKVFVEDGSIYYRAQKPDGQFDSKVKISSLNRFTHTSSTTTTFGASAHLGSRLMASMGVSKSTIRSETDTYFAEVNGDGLVDLVRKGQVWYNVLDENGHPGFVSDVNQVPFPTAKSNSIDVELLKPDKEDYEEQLNENKLQDVVRVWEAPYDGEVKVSGVINLLVDSIPMNYDDWDGVRVAIQVNDVEKWSTEITSVSNTKYFPNGVDHLYVKKGDRIFFRLQSRINGMYDIVRWNPQINYLDKPDELVDINGKSYFSFNAAEDFLLSWPEGISFPMSGNVRIVSQFKKPITTDDVYIEYYLKDTLNNESLIRKEVFPWDQEIESSIEFTLDVEGLNNLLYVKAYSNSNVDWNTISLQTEREYLSSSEEGGSIEDVNKMKYISVPHIVTYDSLLLNNILEYVPYTVPKTGKIRLLNNASEIHEFDGEVNYVLKRKDRQPIVEKIDSIVPDTLFMDVEVSAGEIVHIGSYTESRDAFEKSSVDFTIQMIGVDTLITDSIYIQTFSEGSIVETTRKWYRLLKEKVIIDSVFTYNMDGQQIDYYKSMIDRDTVPYFNYVDEILPRVDSFYTESGDTIVSKIVSRNTEYLDYILEEQEYKVLRHASRTYSRFGHGYRGWGQFCYNNVELGFSEKPIDTQLFDLEENVNTDMKEEDLNVSVDPNDDFESNTGNIESSTGVNTSSALVVMYPDDELNGWVGVDSTFFITSDLVSSSRQGDKTLVAFEEYEKRAQASVNMRGITKKGKTESTIFMLGAQLKEKKDSEILNPDSEENPVIASASGTVTVGKSKMQSDFMDMNGDGFPDIISNGKIQYSLADGSLGEELFEIGGNVTSSESKTTGFSENGLIPVAKKMEDGVEKIKGINIGMSFGDATDEDLYTFLDINGDGLPDKVYKTGEVELNYGYSFGEKEKWFSDSGVRKVEAVSLKVPVDKYFTFDPESGEVTGASVSISKWGGSFQAGLDVSANKSHGNIQYVDVNGDGLPDRVETTSGVEPYTTIKLNTGCGFTDLVDGFSWNGALQRQHNINAGFHTAFTVGFPFLGMKFVTNPSIEVSQSLSRTTQQLMDYNGDGFPDYVTSKHSDKLSVRYSAIGKTNLLRKVHLPLGASVTLDYEQTINSYQMPQRRWVLSEMQVDDNHPGDGADVSRTEFEYSDGYYDRYERTFYGFKNVVTKEIDTENGNSVYRKTVDQYENRSYYTQGILTGRTTMDGNDRVYLVNEYDYLFKKGTDNLSAEELPQYSDASDYVYPYLTASTTYYYEGADSPGKSVRYEYVYDERGNIIQYKDLGDVDAGDIPIISDITYHVIADKYIYNVPASIIVSSGGQIYRKRETSVDDKGQIISIREYLSEADYREFSIEYDDYGNIAKKIFPENYKGEKMFYQYTYDSEVHAFPVKVEDAFGYSSSTVYDYRFGVPLKIIDINNNPMEYGYDSKGRLTIVRGPKEIEAGVEFTIKHLYRPDADIPMGITRHYDESHPDDFIETAIFVDGLGRVVQTKRDATVLIDDGLSTGDNEEPEYADVMTVSGKEVYDAFGRVIESYYPTIEDLGNISIFNESVAEEEPTRKVYDVMDRELSVTLPDGSVTEYRYAFENDRDGNLQFVTTIIDPLKNETKEYKTVRGWHTATLMPDDIWLSKKYDGIGQLIEVRDHYDNLTKSEYDMLGRRLTRVHPDAGTTRWTYDKAGNVLSLLNNHTPLPIEYEYEYSRLIQIKYPYNSHNNVTYEYGEPGASNNRAGRIAKQIDATGAQIFSYGNMGEIVKTLRTIVVPDNGRYSFVTLWEYDSWNRIKKMCYPDGEVVEFSYNSGGAVVGMKGTKGLNEYEYVTSVGYDKYGNRKYIKYGNGTHTHYQYNALNLRLENLQTFAGDGRVIQNNIYEYDAVGNILKLTNDADEVTDPAKFGGPTTHTYSYDNRYRLIDATGTYKGKEREYQYNMHMEYDDMGNIVRKQQSNRYRLNDGEWVTVPETTMDYSYQYEGEKPNAVSSISDAITGAEITFGYDKSGNNIFAKNSIASSDREIVWTEDNRIAAIKAKGNVSHYLYDAGGTRTIKMHSTSLNISINGVSAASATVDGNFTIYVNPYTVVRKNQCTKHYFLGSQRILAKISSNDVTETFFEGNASSEVSNVDYDNKQEALEEAFSDNAEKLNAGWYRDSRGRVPGIYIKHYLRSKEYGGISGQNPWAGDGSLGDSTQVTNPTYEQKQYYYHPDHLGSSNYLTDVLGEAYQHVEYLPWGETFLEERNTQTDKNTYLYTSKELDLLTGLYYYGARYYDPSKSTFLGVDLLAEKYAGVSSFAYVGNNPIIRIDPDGRDIWELNNSGHVVNRIENTEIDQFVIIDNDGNRIEGNTYEYGTVTERKGHKDSRDRDITFFEVAGDDNATAIFEFFGDNYTTTSNMPVEWTHAKVGKDDSGRNIVGTIHEPDRTSVGHYLRTTGYTLREVNHNHPGGSDPSGIPRQPDGRPATGDIRGAELYQNKFPDVKLNVYRSRIAYPDKGGYHPYNRNGFIPSGFPGWRTNGN